MTKIELTKEVVIENCKDHPEGCYIRFRKLKKNEIVQHSEPRNDVVIDFDKDNNIIGIEFYFGMGYQAEKRFNKLVHKKIFSELST